MEQQILLYDLPMPDGRLELYSRRKRTEILVGSGIVLERVFCVNCGTDGGAVYKGCPVFYLCDDCVGKWGPPEGAFEVEVR